MADRSSVTSASTSSPGAGRPTRPSNSMTSPAPLQISSSCRVSRMTSAPLTPMSCVERFPRHGSSTSMARTSSGGAHERRRPSRGSLRSSGALDSRAGSSPWRASSQPNSPAPHPATYGDEIVAHLPVRNLIAVRATLSPRRSERGTRFLTRVHASEPDPRDLGWPRVPGDRRTLQHSPHVTCGAVVRDRTRIPHHR